MPYDGGKWRAPDLRVDIEDIDDHTRVIAPAGELDVSTAESFSAAIEEAVAGRERVVVDLAGVSFIDSTAMATLAEWRERVVGAGGAFAVVATDPYQRRLFEITELIDRLAVSESRAAAIAALGANGNGRRADDA